MSDIHSYDGFWLAYLRAHASPVTRLTHYTGVTIALIALATAAATGQWWLALPGIALAYMAAWAGHLLAEGNRPIMFNGARAAAWSLASSFYMYALWLTGRLQPELARAGIAESAARRGVA